MTRTVDVVSFKARPAAAPRCPAFVVLTLALSLHSLAGGDEKTQAHPSPARQHRDIGTSKEYTRHEDHYDVPSLVLTDMSGRRVFLPELLERDGPVLLQFIFTTCTTICPVLSSSFAALQPRLDARGDDYRMISISIDPGHDTPAVLKDYAEQAGAGPRWYFLTGSSDAIREVQKSFDATYPGNNKMYHRPYIYLRGSAPAPWVRLDGLLGTTALLTEYLETTGNTTDTGSSRPE